MSAENLQEYVFTARYSRYNPALRRRETFEEAITRVLGMHRVHFAAKGMVVEDLLREVGEAMRQRQVLGSQRALQFGGEPILTKNARMYNCTTSYCDRPRFFSEAQWLLLCGCGVGFSVQWHHIAKLPDIAAPSDGVARYVIPDSIEGWADALGVLISSYFVADQPFPEYFGKLVEFDYNEIRPKGSPITSGTGKAPGPEPLKRSLELIRAHLDRTLARGLTRLRPIDAYDLVMHASDAVLSGGVRRSATICLFSPDDQEMGQAKTGNWFVENPQRARSNNSALLLREGTPKEQFLGLMKAVREFGEPGFVWADDKDITYNPCVEIGLYPQLDGVSGWAFCNLCEINIGAVDSEEKFAQAVRAAAILGTLQADYTSFDYLGEVSEKIARREALLGVSMTGMMEHPEIAFDADLQRRMAQLIMEVNEQVAERIGLNPAARATCIKPAGSTSCILGTSSGIHPHHARRYFRRAQANEDEAIVAFFRDKNPLAVEKSVWNPNGTGVVITFCIDAGQEAMIRKKLSPMDLLAFVKLTKANWIDAGKREERCVPPEEDFWKVFDAAQGQDRVLLAVFLFLAARRGEDFGLKWTDVDFGRKLVRLGTRKRRGGSMEYDWLPMADELYDLLMWWRDKRRFAQAEHVFLCQEDYEYCRRFQGQPFSSRIHYMGRLCERAKVKRFTYHAIRHLTASILYERGYPVSVIQAILRHKSATTTTRYLRSLGLEDTRPALDSLRAYP